HVAHVCVQRYQIAVTKRQSCDMFIEHRQKKNQAPLGAKCRWYHAHMAFLRELGLFSHFVRAINEPASSAHRSTVNTYSPRGRRQRRVWCGNSLQTTVSDDWGRGAVMEFIPSHLSS